MGEKSSTLEVGQRITLESLIQMKARGAKFAMLTAYDYPTARAAHRAGVHSLLVGDSMGTVILGHENTRSVPLSLMLVLAEAVRRGAPGAYLVGDMPFESLSAGAESAFRAALAFRDDASCDAVKIETDGAHAELIRRLRAAHLDVIAHLGLLPQSITSPDGYRAQARDPAAVELLVERCRTVVRAGASMILLEAVPPDASAAVVSAVQVPVIGCGAGPACDGHVVVTQDMLGMNESRPPRFVPVFADVSRVTEEAMRRWVSEIASGDYPGPRHTYSMRTQPVAEGLP